MGIFLNLTVSPDRIPEDQWEKTYEEALRIADGSDLLDCVSLERNGCRYAAARKTAERVFPEEGPGICVCGTMASGPDMEEFFLFRRKPRCCGVGAPDNGADILFEDWYPQDPDIPVPTGTCSLWGEKTQGRPGHIPLLAIACLFADRFPEAVNISGDISAGQCRAAARLAGRCLDRPIQTPVTCRAEALLQRLQKSGIPVQKQAAAFFRLYLGRLTPEVGGVLKAFFPWEELYRYFRNLMTPEEGKEADFSRALRDYLLLELSPVDLLNMLARDTSGPRLPLKEILSKLFACRVHIPFEQKNCTDPMGLDAAVEGDEEEPHEIEAVMGRLFFSMCAGRNSSLPVYLPLDVIRSACRQVFPNEDTDALIEKLLAEPAEDGRQERVYGPGALFSQLEKKAEEQWERVGAYDLREPGNLRRWRPGLTIEPHLKDGLLMIMKKIRAFSVKWEYREFLDLDRAERENYFIRRSGPVLIYETVWEHIFGRVMDDRYIYRFFLLFSVDCSTQKVHDVISSLLANPPLIDMLWEQTEETAETEN